MTTTTEDKFQVLMNTARPHVRETIETMINALYDAETVSQGEAYAR
jgi:hypothetical protein